MNNKFIIFLILLIMNAEAQKIVRYDLYVRDTIVNFAAKKRHAIAVNGTIPLPQLILKRLFVIN